MIVQGKFDSHVDYYLRKYGGVPVRSLNGYVMGDPLHQSIDLYPLMRVHKLKYIIAELERHPKYLREEPIIDPPDPQNVHRLCIDCSSCLEDDDNRWVCSKKKFSKYDEFYQCFYMRDEDHLCGPEGKLWTPALQESDLNLGA